MELEHAYRRGSQVSQSADGTGLSFSPDLTREPTFFTGEIADGLPFRAAMSALHDVVVSDLRFQPKDRTAYKEWAERAHEHDIESFVSHRAELGAKIDSLRKELEPLETELRQLRRPFWDAQQRYFNYLYKKDYDAWFVLDPVITVHPDEVFFECFSQDESSYGRLSVDYEVFRNVGDKSHGTTNVDYSSALHDEFLKIRSYKSTWLEVDPTGFTVETTAEPAYKEVKIELPESWVRGFLQVNSAMVLDAVTFDLHPFDLHAICFLLRRHREIKGPRSLRFQLTPGEPVKVVVEPWNYEIRCARSVYEGDAPQEVRVWGRRRLHVLEKLIPWTRKFQVRLLGTGLPSFWIADLGSSWFTLGLSGWSANDWSRAAHFDLLAPRAEVDEVTAHRVFSGLKETCFESVDALAKRLDLDRSLVLSALQASTQAGRSIFDLNKNVYRLRELTREPLPMEQLRFSNPREEQALALVREEKVTITSVEEREGGGVRLTGRVQRPRGRPANPDITIDGDERMVRAQCDCHHYRNNKLHQGPCDCMLALRLLHARRGGRKER
ncbi:MAG: SWIM zinc finger family protein [Acidobacteriota bacterium]